MEASGFEEGGLDVHVRVIKDGTSDRSQVCVACETVPAVAVATSITGVVSRRGGDVGDPRERSCEVIATHWMPIMRNAFCYMRESSVH